MISVATFYSPRPTHEKFVDYRPFMEIQRKTVKRFGHRHVVISDQAVGDFEMHMVKLPTPLMTAILVGQISFLEAWDDRRPCVLVDADCLIARDLNEAFDGSFDIGLTNRVSAVSPINNGAMYFAAGAKEKALRFMRHALSLCKNHWGGDQEAISQAAAPVPDGHFIEMRMGDIRISFLNMKTHNVIPEEEGKLHKRKPFVVHFKGEHKKAWMKTYAQRFIL